MPSVKIPVRESFSVNISKEELGAKDKNDKADASSASTMGLLEESKGNHESALAHYSKAINLDPKNDVYHSNRGMSFANSGDFKRALADYHTAIKINPNNSVTYDNRGFLKAKIGDNKGALSDYGQAIKIDRNFLASYINRSKLYAKIGDKKNEINDLRKIAEIYKVSGREAEYQQIIQYINNIKQR